MDFGAAIAAGINQATTVGMGLYNNNQARKAQQRALRYDKELSKYNYDLEVEQWNRANAYNAPSAQMQRYKEAGLNPNLIYSQSNEAASSAPTAGASFSGGPGYTEMPSPNSFVDDYTRLTQMQLYADQQAAQIRLMNAQADNYAANTLGLGFSNKKAEAESKYYGVNAKYQSDEFKKRVEQLDLQNQGMVNEIKTFGDRWNLLKQNLKAAETDNIFRIERNQAEIDKLYQDIANGKMSVRKGYAEIDKLKADTVGIKRQNVWIDRINEKNNYKLTMEAEAALYQRDIYEIQRDYAEEMEKAKLYDRSINGSSTTHPNSGTWVNYGRDVMNGKGRSNRPGHKSGVKWHYGY